MTVKEGKNQLQQCLQQMSPCTNIDDLICYKYGNRKRASEYQRDDIIVTLTDKDRVLLKDGVPFIVQCFIHTGIYAAWPQEAGRGNGKCVVYKKSVVEMEENQTLTYKSVLIGNGTNDVVYLFRGEAGIKEFIRSVLLKTTA